MAPEQQALSNAAGVPAARGRNGVCKHDGQKATHQAIPLRDARGVRCHCTEYHLLLPDLPFSGLWERDLQGDGHPDALHLRRGDRLPAQAGLQHGGEFSPPLAAGEDGQHSQYAGRGVLAAVRHPRRLRPVHDDRAAARYQRDHAVLHRAEQHPGLCGLGLQAGDHRQQRTAAGLH